MEGLSTLFRQNPYEKRIQATGQMMASSGFAKPLLALMLGRDMKAAEQWDKNQATEGMSLLRGQVENEKSKQDFDTAVKIMDKAIELADKDPVRATDYVNAVGRGNPVIDKLIKGGFQFNSKTQDNWMYGTYNGQFTAVYKPGLQYLEELMNTPASISPKAIQEAVSKIIVPLTTPTVKEPETPYKKGERRTFTGKDGLEYEGTYQGQDEKNEPIFTNVVKKKDKNSIRQLGLDLRSMSTSELISLKRAYQPNLSEGYEGDTESLRLIDEELSKRIGKRKPSPREATQGTGLAAPSPDRTPEVTKTLNGKRYHKINGRWYEG